jgi:3-keto-5-aminohexanoate cleavage enzyme
MHKTIINFCPTGMIPTKSLTRHVPISPDEIIEQTHEAYELGISIVHLHARNEDGSPTYRSDIYQKIFEGIRFYCPELIICASTSGRDWPEIEKRSEVIELHPDMCSLTLSSLNFTKKPSINSPETIQILADKMKQNGVVPELECFDMGMINYGLYLIRKNILVAPFYWNLLFGNIAGFQPTFSQIGAALQEIPKNHFVVMAGIGEHQLAVNATSIAMGYGVRVGIEDNIWWDTNRSIPASNIDLIRRIHNLMHIHETSLMTSRELRSMGLGNNKLRETFKLINNAS